MSIRVAITELLQADAQLVELLDDNAEAIYHRTAPQDVPFPMVILSKQAGGPFYTFGDHHDNDLWTVKGVDRGLTAEVAEALDARIRAVLQDAELNISATTLWFRREEDVDYGEREEGAVIHHVGAMYRLLTQP